MEGVVASMETSIEVILAPQHARPFQQFVNVVLGLFKMRCSWGVEPPI